MTEREKEILNILRLDPLISQQELADKLSITRSSVAVHITNLMKKGHVKGKGYILSKGNYVTVIGGSNMDIQGVPKGRLVMNDSNPGYVNMSLGGVGRNIADNISRLDINTKLISAVGDDLYGNTILTECNKFGIDVDDCLVSNDCPTSVYISILNGDHDMQVAISHMDVVDKLNTNYISSKHQSIEDSLAIIIDTNLPKETIDYITSTYNDTPIFIDTVSTTKCQKIKDIIGRFNTIKVNRYEAEALTGKFVRTERDLKRAAKFFLEKGVKSVFITLGKDGVYCATRKEAHFIEATEVDIVNATGAGDAFTAALVYSYINNYDLKQTAKFASAASVVALSHKDTINPNMSVENIKNTLREII